MAGKSDHSSIRACMKSRTRFSIDDILNRDSGASSLPSIKDRDQDRMTPSASTAGKVLLSSVRMINEQLIVMQCVHGFGMIIRGRSFAHSLPGFDNSCDQEKGEGDN